MDICSLICEIVNENPGINAIELTAKILKLTLERLGTIPNMDFMEAIDRAVFTKHILEVEYVTPQMNYRIKSLYFPAGTEITVKN